MIGDYSYLPYGFRKARVYASVSKGGVLGVPGYTDGIYDYGLHKSGGWIAIERATGCSVALGKTIQEAQRRAFDPTNQARIKHYMSTPRYVEKCEEFNAALIEAGLVDYT